MTCICSEFLLPFACMTLAVLPEMRESGSGGGWGGASFNPYTTQLYSTPNVTELEKLGGEILQQTPHVLDYEGCGLESIRSLSCSRLLRVGVI